MCPWVAWSRNRSVNLHARELTPPKSYLKGTSIPASMVNKNSLINWHQKWVGPEMADLPPIAIFIGEMAGVQFLKRPYIPVPSSNNAPMQLISMYWKVWKVHHFRYNLSSGNPTLIASDPILNTMNTWLTTVFICIYIIYKNKYPPGIKHSIRKSMGIPYAWSFI